MHPARHRAPADSAQASADQRLLVERFNGRISEIVRQTRFGSVAELEATLTNYLYTYNHHIPQRALKHLSPVEALQAWRKKSPELFVKRVCKQSELDTYAKPHVSGGQACRVLNVDS